MTASTYHLVYFPLRGRANLIRMILHTANVQYTETTVTDWPAGKSSTPFGQLPVWRETDSAGKTITELGQSGAISRLLARRYHLLPSDELKAAWVESIVDSWSDIRDMTVNVFLAKTDDEKKKFSDETVEKTIALAAFHANMLKDGFYLQDTLSLADLALFDVLNQVVRLDSEVLAKIHETVARAYRRSSKRFATLMDSDFQNNAPI